MPLHDFKPNKAEVSLENSNVGKKIAKRQSFKSTCWNYIYIVVETRYIFEVIRFLLSIHRSYQTKNRVLYVSNCCITLYGWHFLLAGLLFDEGELFQKYVLKTWIFHLKQFRKTTWHYLTAYTKHIWWKIISLVWKSRWKIFSWKSMWIKQSFQTFQEFHCVYTYKQSSKEKKDYFFSYDPSGNNHSTQAIRSR